MKVAYFDCFSGISGDMILGALVDLGVDVDYLKGQFKKIDISGYDIKAKKVEKQHIHGTKVDIVIKEKQRHRSLKDINELIDKSGLDKEVKQSSKKIFLKIAEVESKIHNIDINKVHFDEIGALDSILDVVGAVIGLKKLNIEKVYSSHLNLGRGFVECSHGLIPVPAPATAEILKGVPVYSTNVEAELVTPTGSAVITSLTNDFGPMPPMTIDKLGYGAGKADFQHPNLLRIFIGDLVSAYDTDFTNMIETNIDDINPEIYSYLVQKLLDHGALDVFLTNIQMKKSRPAVKLSVISSLEDTEKLTDMIFNETTTLGVRIYQTERRKLFIKKKRVKTKYGDITIKVGKLNDKVKTISPEYEDCQSIAEKNNIPLKDIYDLAKRPYLSK
jgi:uncharacterized protein (TIGR00299 family) protein